MLLPMPQSSAVEAHHSSHRWLPTFHKQPSKNSKSPQNRQRHDTGFPSRILCRSEKESTQSLQFPQPYQHETNGEEFLSCCHREPRSRRSAASMPNSSGSKPKNRAASNSTREIRKAKKLSGNESLVNVMISLPAWLFPSLALLFLLLVYLEQGVLA